MPSSIACPRCEETFRIEPALLPDERVRTACLACGQPLYLRLSRPFAPDAVTTSAASPEEEVPLWKEPAPTDGHGAPPLERASSSEERPAGPPQRPLAPPIERDEPAGFVPPAVLAAPPAALSAPPAPVSEPPIEVPPEPAPSIEARVERPLAPYLERATPPPTSPREAPTPAPPAPLEAAAPPPATEEPSSPPSAAPGPASTPRPAPKAFTFSEVGDASARAQRLARALVSDIVVYQPKKVEQGVRDGNLKDLLREEVEKSWDEYCERLGPEVARAHRPTFIAALNEILARGATVF